MWTRTFLKNFGIQALPALLAVLLCLCGPVAAGTVAGQSPKDVLPESAPGIPPAEKELPTLDLPTHGGITPYLGAGVEGAEENPEALDKEQPSVQVDAGVKYGLDSSTTLSLGYRGTLPPLPELQESLEARNRPVFEGHSITFGLKKAF